MRYSLRKTVLSIILISIYFWLRAYDRQLKAIRIQQASLIVSTEPENVEDTTEVFDREHVLGEHISDDEVTDGEVEETVTASEDFEEFLEEKIDHDKDVWWDGDEEQVTEPPEESEYDVEDFERVNTEIDNEGDDDSTENDGDSEYYQKNESDDDENEQNEEDDENEDENQDNNDTEENQESYEYQNYTSNINDTYEYEYSTKPDTEGYEDYRGIMDLENNNPSVEDIEDEDYQYSDDMPSKDSNDNYLIDYDAWVSDEEGAPTADNDAVHIYYDTENITAAEFQADRDDHKKTHVKKGLSFLEDAINQLENFENGDKKFARANVATIDDSFSAAPGESDFIGGEKREKSLQEKIDEQVDTFLEELTWEKENEINEIGKSSFLDGKQNSEEMVKFTDSDVQKMQQKWMNSNISSMIIVHLDFKAGNIPLRFLEQLLPSIKNWGANTILLELEEFYPFQGDLKAEQTSAGENTLKQGDVNKILKLASLNDLHVIPYINLCSDLGFLLNRNSKYHAFQTNDIDTINPGVSSSVEFSVNLMKQMVGLYKEAISWVHIGCRLPGHYGWSMAEKSWMHSSNSGLGELYLNYLSQVTAKIHKDFSKLKLIVWGNDLMKISPFSISKYNITNHIYPMFESYRLG